MSAKLYTCPDCKNGFVQPLTCVTCGAQKLYDHTVTSLQAENLALREVLLEACNLLKRQIDFKSNEIKASEDKCPHGITLFYPCRECDTERHSEEF